MRLIAVGSLCVVGFFVMSGLEPTVIYIDYWAESTNVVIGAVVMVAALRLCVNEIENSIKANSKVPLVSCVRSCVISRHKCN